MTSVADLSQALKTADVDINGMNRKVSLRRKMTVLSRDPVRNEKLLKKRALERELKVSTISYYILIKKIK